MRFPEVMRTGEYKGEKFPIKCLYVCNANPVASESGKTAILEGMSKIDFIVTADSFMSDTARYSDIVLPICLSFEEEDMFYQGAGTPQGYMMQKAIEPLGECRSDMDVYRALSDAMGFPELFDKTDEEYLRNLLDSEENIANGYAYDDFKEHGAICNYDLTPTVGQETNATGRLQFYLANIISRDGGIVKFEDKEYIPWYEHALEAYYDNPLREKYPLFGSSEHNHFFAHSLFNNIPWLDELRPEPIVEINENTARARGIEQGDLVRVYNERGYVVLKAVLTNGIREDTVQLPHGWQELDYMGGHHQNLTLTYCDFTGNAPFYDYLCEVEKYEGDVE